MPFAESHDLPEFRQWLVATLEPMCDADPAVMSDYIVALLKHDAVMSDEDWKAFVTRELADFLESNSRPFVESLFQTLQTKSFLPTAAPAVNPAIVPVPPSTTSPAINAPSLQSSYRPGQPSTSTAPPPSGPKRDSAGPAGPSGSSVAPVGLPSRPSDDVEMDAQPGGKQKCFDYHERGYCMRGVDCPFEHDADVIIPTPEMMFGQMAMGMPPPFMPQRGGGRDGRGGRGRGGNNHGTGHVGNGNNMNGGQPGTWIGPSGQPGNPGPAPPMGPFFPFPMGMPMPMPLPFNTFPPKHAQESEFWGTNRPPREEVNTLVITDIPKSSLSVPIIRDYFSQFGEVTNVAIDAPSKRALVTFNNNREAYIAWKSDEAVFGSRHVKVLWHRPRPGKGTAGQIALEKSTQLINNLNKIQSGEVIQQGKSAKLAGPESRLRDTLAELEARERRSKQETLIAEQKVLLNRAKSADKEEKLQILMRLKELTKEMEDLKKPKEEPVDLEMSDKDRLDAELEKHGMESTKGKDQEELLRLAAQLSALKEKASDLGISPSTSRYSPYPGARGSRGRGRARGRGGSNFPPRPMRLDNRTRIITVTTEGTTSEEAKSSLRAWYESTEGNVEVVEKGLTVTYPTREQAEKALAMGTKDIPHVSQEVTATWYNAPAIGQIESQEVDMGETHGRRGDHDEED